MCKRYKKTVERPGGRLVATHLVFETHSLSEDNERGIATGWLNGRLSDRGRALARELGERRRNNGISVVFTSDLGRAVETARIAFEGSTTPVLCDWRLRECNYGDKNGRPGSEVHRDRRLYLHEPYPGGESWQQAVQRVGQFLDDLQPRWEGSRILVIGHIATKWAFDHLLEGVTLEELVEADFAWREGWEYRLD